MYYKVYLQVARPDSKYVFGFINISHIPYAKFEELFIDQVTSEKFLFDQGLSYFIDESIYLKNKDFWDTEIPFTFDFTLFEYSVSLTGDSMNKLPKNYYEELPGPLKK